MVVKMFRVVLMILYGVRRCTDGCQGVAKWLLRC